MPHGDAIIHGYGIKLFSHTAGLLNLPGNHLSQIFEVHMTWNKLSKGVYNRDNGFFEIPVFHTGGAPKSSGASHVAAMGGRAGTILRHGPLQDVVVYSK